MLKLKHFLFDARGSAGKAFALGMAVLGLTSVVAADMMSRLVQKGALPTILIIPSDQSLGRLANTDPTSEPNSLVTKVMRGIGIDMSATGAIPSSTPASPCAATRQTVLLTRSVGVEGTTATAVATPEPPCDQSHKKIVFLDAN
jgi:hypothetical protein